MRRIVVIGGLTARLQEAIAAAGSAQQGKIELAADRKERTKGNAERISSAVATEIQNIEVGGAGYLRADNNTRRYIKIKPRIPKNSKAYKRAYKYHK